MITRRQLLRSGAYASIAVMVAPGLMMKRGPSGQPVLFAIPGGTLDPGDVAKYVTALVKPPAMPRSRGSNKNRDLYRIGVRQFEQQILPSGRTTTVWSYGSVDAPGTFNYPAFTIEATWNKRTQVLWSNQLVDARGRYLPHLLPIDQTLHWANPPGGPGGRDMRGSDPTPYTGPVPIVTHVHGAHTTEDSDGYAEAWYLPDAVDIPPGYATTGTFYDYYSAKYDHFWSPGTASFMYPNDQPAATLWYHDHTLGMTRNNVYAGPAGFWLIRGGPNDVVHDRRDGSAATLPGPAPGVGDSPFGTYYEIPLAIQDRSFNDDGSLFYPDNRSFFEGLDPSQLRIPFIPDLACDGEPSDVSPIWNPEFFGNMIVVNGRTWPYLDVEQRRYRFRLLNGCNSRFLILDFGDLPGVEVWVIGGDQGFLNEPVNLSGDHANRLLLGPAERADVIVDFTHVAPDAYVLRNVGPDEPFGGGVPGVDFAPADPSSTGQVMQLRVGPALSPDPSTPAQHLVPVAAASLGPSTRTRALSLNEEESHTVRTSEDDHGRIVLDCGTGEVFGPTSALLGTLAEGPQMWSSAVTENPALGAIEEWQFHNFTEDAHPMHIHQVQFEVVSRQRADDEHDETVRPPEPWERGFKDTVIAYPGEITRVKARYDLPGFYVWHCHIVEHEDNEMMRPFHVGPIPPDAPTAELGSDGQASPRPAHPER